MPHSIDPSITTPEASTTREAPRAPAVAPIDYPSFRPRAPWWGGDLQTLRNTVMRPRSRLARSTAEGLRFSMADGTGDVLLGLLNRPEGEAAPDKPLAVLVHGLTGCAESSYMLATASALLRRGYGVLRLNLRGAGPSRPLCRQQYHAGRTQDIRAVLAQLPADLTRSGIVLTGYSLGGNVVLKLLGEGTPPGVRAGGAGRGFDIGADRPCRKPGPHPAPAQLVLSPLADRPHEGRGAGRAADAGRARNGERHPHLLRIR
jgi:alpha/beta superfamily hydrolase